MDLREMEKIVKIRQDIINELIELEAFENPDFWKGYRDALEQIISYF